MKTSSCLAAIAMCALAGTSAQASVVVSQSGHPDFSQHVLSLTNHCAPTCATDLAYYFGQTHSALSGTWMDNGAANGIIVDMATRMGTSLTGGTTPNQLVTGLDDYFEDNWDSTIGGTDWDTYYLRAIDVGTAGNHGAAFWAELQAQLNAGAGVILLIRWQFGIPTGYDVPDDYDPDQFGSNHAMGHAVTMVGYDTGTNSVQINDPANNGGTHFWAGEYLSTVVTTNPNDLHMTVGGSTATVYGAVITTPAPGALALLLLASLVGASRRR